MAFKVRIKAVDTSNFARSQVRSVTLLSERQIRAIAEETAKAMKDNIQESITRANSSGNLGNSIFAEQIINGYGVGNIGFLNDNAPYWRHVNFGSVGIGASHSHRVPAGAFQPGTAAPIAGGAGQRWETGSGNFSFIPGRPIQPLNYIAKTLSEIDSIVRRVLRRVN